MNYELLMPMLAHILWTALLYVVLTLMRAPTIWNIGARADGSNPWSKIEKKVSANLSNQFEWPLFFYVACIIVMTNPSLYNSIYLWFAWIFFVGRLLHSGVQILTDNIRLRGLVFTINFVSVLLIWTGLAVYLL